MFLLAISPGAWSQDTAEWISGEWQPETEHNERLFDEAQDKYKAAVREAMQKRREQGRTGESREGGGMRRGGGMERGGGMRGGMGRGGGRGGGGRPNFSLVDLLPGELNFAAPINAGLILQRTRDAVLFGRTDSDAVTFIPLAGKTDLGNGFQASMREENGQLVLLVDLPSGRRVQYRYSTNSGQTPGGLRVDISVDGNIPGGSVELQRVYRRVQVDVGAPEQVGP